jgi:exosortase C (VPDSG-CTERM-specific)
MSEQIAIPTRKFPVINSIALVVLFAVFALPLGQLTRFAMGDELQSFILLIPLVSIYLLVEKRELIPGGPISRIAVLRWSAAGTLFLVLYLASCFWGYPLRGTDALTFSTLAFVCGVVAIATATFTAEVLRKITFPLGFLFFMTPWPKLVIDGFAAFLQYGSAELAACFFALTRMPQTRDRLLFHFPNITIEVARECSGIHSTIVLFIICVVAGQLFLQNPRHRLLLVCVALPLGIVRNALRIWLISWLCVHVGPEMIKSPIHRRGGPVFFALSIVPLVLLIAALRRRENRNGVLQAAETRKPSGPINIQLTEPDH